MADLLLKQVAVLPDKVMPNDVKSFQALVCLELVLHPLDLKVHTCK